MAELDPLIHAPARLQVLTTLSAVSEAEFATLRNALQVSDSVLSKHISTLADAGYVRSRNGHQIVFSILVNHRRLNILAAHKLQDRIVQALAGSRPRG